MKSYLYNSNVKNCYTHKNIYRLAVKITPQQWEKVKKYFKYYNFDELTAWGTIHPTEVIKILLEDENTEYQEINQKIVQAQKDCANANGYLEAEELTGLITNLEYERSKLVLSYIP